MRSLVGVRPFFAVIDRPGRRRHGWAEPPVASYIFPAGGQRGTTAAFKVGGMLFKRRLHVRPRGARASPRPSGIARTKTIWFEGPPMARPASNMAESYPQDFAGTVRSRSDGAVGDAVLARFDFTGNDPAQEIRGRRTA